MTRRTTSPTFFAASSFAARIAACSLRLASRLRTSCDALKRLIVVYLVFFRTTTGLDPLWSVACVACSRSAGAEEAARLGPRFSSAARAATTCATALASSGLPACVYGMTALMALGGS